MSERRGNGRVVVVGAGMAGSVTALGLARQGHRVTLVDRGDAISLDIDDPLRLRVSTLNLATIRLLKQLEVWPAIRAARCQPFEQIVVWQDDPDDSLEFDARDASFTHLGAVVENDWVCQHLQSALQQEPGVEILFGRVIEQMEHGNRHTRLRCDDGTTLSADLVVAADGAGSALRQMAGIATEWHSYHQNGLVCVVESAEDCSQAAWQRFLPGGPLAFLPLASQRFSIVWSLPDTDSDQLRDCEPEEFIARLQQASQNRFGEISLASDRAAFPLRRLKVDRYIDQRLVLVGDAAHVIHPLAGQGANIGFQDAATLLELTATASDDGLDPFRHENLRGYERWRRADNAVTMQAMDGLKWSFEQAGGLIARSRDATLRLINRNKWLRRPFVQHAAGFGGRTPALMKRR